MPAWCLRSAIYGKYAGAGLKLLLRTSGRKSIVPMNWSSA